MTSLLTGDSGTKKLGMTGKNIKNNITNSKRAGVTSNKRK